LWVIGFDEKTGAVKSPPKEKKFEEWWAQVVSYFDDSTAPAMVDHLSFALEGEHVSVLYFETDQSPYVVKKKGERLVMWREGTLTRSAKRSELLKLMVPLEPLPIVEAPTVSVDVFRTRRCR
jgi:hypothetical protein